MKKLLAGLGFSVVITSGLFANSLMMATTTSTEDTGLLDSLAPKFKQDTGIELKWVSTGTGKALKMGENCDVDILLVHAPEAEKKFVEAGFGKDELLSLQNAIDAEKCDLFDVLEFVAYEAKMLTRETRVANAQRKIFALLDHDQKEFVEFVLSKYIETGVEELDQEKLPQLLELKYQAVSDAAEKLGGVSRIRELFIDFQRHLYGSQSA